MTVTTLFFFEGVGIGAVISAAVLFFLWASDLRDRDRKEKTIEEKAYDKGFDDGYEVGGRMRFRERCQIARRCRELEKMIRENVDEKIQM